MLSTQASTKVYRVTPRAHALQGRPPRARRLGVCQRTAGAPPRPGGLLRRLDLQARATHPARRGRLAGTGGLGFFRPPCDGRTLAIRRLLEPARRSSGWPADAARLDRARRRGDLVSRMGRFNILCLVIIAGPAVALPCCERVVHGVIAADRTACRLLTGASKIGRRRLHHPAGRHVVRGGGRRRPRLPALRPCTARRRSVGAQMVNLQSRSPIPNRRSQSSISISNRQ